MKDGRNLTLVMDFYELTMSQCYYKEHREEEVIFDLFIVKIQMMVVSASLPV